MAEFGVTAANFPRALSFVLLQEGGWSNRPDDHGGPTNQGITLATFNDHCGPGLTADDLRAMDNIDRDQIYKEAYWLAIEGDDLPSGVDLCVFDFAVNAGPGRAIKTLQHALGIKEDGIVGPVTLAIAAKADPMHLITGITLGRMRFYTGLNQPDFLRGWTARAHACQTAALTLVQMA